VTRAECDLFFKPVTLVPSASSTPLSRSSLAMVSQIFSVADYAGRSHLNGRHALHVGLYLFHLLLRQQRHGKSLCNAALDKALRSCGTSELLEATISLPQMSCSML
jgi:hypothetical protein